MSEYPYVECPRHPALELPGFAVCRHVLDDAAPVAVYYEPTRRTLGGVLCERCSHADDVRVEDLRCICSLCVAQLLAARAPVVDS
jgi:hypothetical protein